MQNLIDEIRNDHIILSKILDLLDEQLDIIHQGKSVDYHLLQDAITFLENFPENVLEPKENAILKSSADKFKFVGLNSEILKLRSENHELKALAQSLREYISAALEDIMFEKEPFEQKLETCIQRQREHIDTEELTILPLLKKMITEEQLDELSTGFKSQKEYEKYQRNLDQCEKLYEQLND